MKRVQKYWNILKLVPVMLSLALIPLIVSAKVYENGLSDYAWFSSTTTSVDLFLYWKGQALIVLAIVMAVFLVVQIVQKGYLLVLWEKIRRPEMACILLYILFAGISAVLSEYPETALYGGYEQWEGLNILAAYVVLMVYTYITAGTEKMVRYIVYSLVLGGFLLGLTGTLQYLQIDFFRTDMGRFFMNLMSGHKMNFTFNFSSGWVYATLYNPNYVGSYAALVLPVVIAVAVMDWGKICRFWSVLAMVTTCLLIVTLLGSQSLTGCVGVAAAFLFFILFVWKRLVDSLGWKKIVTGTVALAVFVGAMCLLFPDEIRYGMDKLFHPTEDYHVITSMLDTEKGLQVKTVKGDVFYLEFTGSADNPFLAKEENGEEMELQKEKDAEYYTFSDSRFDNFRLYPTTATVNGKVLTAVRIFNPTINKQWTIAWNGSYQVFTAHNKLDKLEEIDAIGFEDNLHFGDKRGYIWSRTLPLLGRYLITGSGPDTFTEVFPNNDYVGKTNMNYDGVAVTKPHNMYLQIWVQTGLVSMIAYVMMFLFYLISSIRLYYCCTVGIMEEIGIAVMTGCFGYMVTGLANDSTVTVAPVFWGLMGLGMAVNHLVRKNQIV